MGFLDLHNHFYGSLSAETLFSIGKNNPSPRWFILTEFYKKHFGKEFDTDNFFKEFEDIERFKEFYYFRKPAPFLEFQAKFNLIIALIRFDEEEIQFVANEILRDHLKEGVDFAEYRIMFPPNADSKVYHFKTIAACKGLQNGEFAAKNKIKGKLVVSLHRNGNYLEQYLWLKSLMKENELVNKYLVGIDFCNIEEGFPPIEKKEFFSRILKDNSNNPESSLSILYHVGESFADKTPKSAVRWVAESALYGAHRLGHCLSLGINPESFSGKVITETVRERLDQIEFEIKYYDQLKSIGATSNYTELSKQKEILLTKKKEEEISIEIDKEYIDELNTFQEFAMRLIRDETSSVIESCPTSNLYIGMLSDIKHHPIRRFIQNGLKVTIGSDDPGLFATNLKQEYELAARAGLSQQELEKIKISSKSYTSEKLSGRKL